MRLDDGKMPFGVPWSNSPPVTFHEARRRLRLVKGRQSEQIWAGTDCYLGNIG
jgi:hypothetical protein